MLFIIVFLFQCHEYTEIFNATKVKRKEKCKEERTDAKISPLPFVFLAVLLPFFLTAGCNSKQCAGLF